MKIMLKQSGFLWDKKVCVPATIADILVKQDPLFPAKGKVLVFYKGDQGKGILEFSLEEFAQLHRSVTPAVQLLLGSTLPERSKRKS